MITDQLLDTNNMCTFIMNLCNLDKWYKVDVKEWINNILGEKPEAAEGNNFIDNLYKDKTTAF